MLLTSTFLAYYKSLFGEHFPVKELIKIQMYLYRVQFDEYVSRSLSGESLIPLTYQGLRIE